MLDLLRDDTKLHRSCQLDHCRDHFLIHKICLQVSCVGTINFQVVDRQMFEAREGTESAAEIIERKFGTNAVQDLDEALRMLHVGQYRGLCYLEADCRWRDTRSVQRINNEAEKSLIAKRLAGQVDRATTSRREFDLPAGDRTERRIDHPAVDLRHHLITLGRAQELSGIVALPSAIREANQDLYRRPGVRFSGHRDDGLYSELKAVFMQSGLQLPQPLYIAALSRHRFIAGRVNMHLSPALLFRHVASRIGSAHYVLQRSARMADFNQADRYANVKYFVLPHEPVVSYGVANICCDLPGLLDRAANQE